MTAKLYLGVDGGGTGTRAVVADRSGRVLGVGLAGSTNLNHHPRSVVVDHLRTAVEAALARAGSTPRQVQAAFLGVCGISTEADKMLFADLAREVIEPASRSLLKVENDAVAGLTGGLSGRPGGVLIAGTGSACLGTSGDGRACWVGGWGALADDDGSAGWVGVEAIRAAVRAEDGRAGSTVLREVVFGFLGLDDPRELIDRVHNRGLDRSEIARLAPLVVEAAEGGDARARAIVGEAVARLSSLAAAVVRRLGVVNSWDLVLAGGLARSGPPFEPRLVARIALDVPMVRVVEPDLPPVGGAVLEALRLDGVSMTPEVVENLRMTWSENS